ncbi:M15 family metallopeptidase [Ramlibacter algicola]|uniref:M15 family metallopeptidase n=1 Tax=Ramlibacter algicola TaxID=2795217 RepID=A0A934Q2R5_9BURK|nr:M15 family metallopeptidase [Ramlibacter algicola]MBK0393738.1 M15 family metallopeptidase [Ramlibacter algicola]
MPSGNYVHPLIGSTEFETQSHDWVRGDVITFTSGFNVTESIGVVVVPQLVAIKQAHHGRIHFHVRAHAQLLSAFADIEKRGLLHLVQKVSRGFHPRLRKPTDGSISHKPSNHAFGLAIDLNSDDGSNGGSTAPLHGIFEAHGFAWGNNFPSPDPMHYEVVTFLDEAAG